MRAAQANLDRLRVLEQYKRLVAPFDGLVTARTTDVGALINAGAGGGPPMFVVSEISKLRVYVNVPQNYVPGVPVGTKAQISVPEYPGRTFPATVEASAQSVDVASSTTRMQLVVDNSCSELMTGDFTNVTFDLPHPAVADQRAGKRADLRSERIAGRDRQQRRSHRTSSRSRSRAISARKSKSAPGITAEDRVVDQPAGWHCLAATRCASPAPGTPGRARNRRGEVRREPVDLSRPASCPWQSA